MIGVRRGGGGGRTRGEQTTRLEEADLGIKESRVERSLSAVQQAVKKANSPNANTYIWKDMHVRVHVKGHGKASNFCKRRVAATCADRTCNM